jgi:4-phytase/acid phosphatase
MFLFRGAAIGASLALLALAPAALAAPRGKVVLERAVLERVVILQRHGVRPPTSTNDALAHYAQQPWPKWPVAAGELTAHGGETVRLVGSSLRRAYAGILPARGCPASGEVVVWADGSDQRTRRSGEILAQALAPGCQVKAAWAPPLPRDPIFNGDRTAPACRIEPAAAEQALAASIGPGGIQTPATRAALARLQAIVAPRACAGGAGTCFSGPDRVVSGPNGPRLEGPLATTASLAEDLLLEYAQGMPRSEVGWGRVGTAADIAAVMPLHERYFAVYHGDRYAASRDGAPMARLILAALAGEPGGRGPEVGPRTRLLALAGHDSNLVIMGAVFGLTWTLPDEPDSTAPATALAFELWSRGRMRYVRPAIYYASLDQLRTLSPATARRRVLQFRGCASGAMGGCPVSEVRRRVIAFIPPGCGPL